MTRDLAVAAAAVTVLYAASALGRLVPVKRRHHNWRHTSAMGLASVLVLALGGCAFVSASRMKPSPLPSYPADTPAVSNSLPIGVFAPGEWDSWSPVQQFDQQAGQPVQYILDYMGQDQPFPGNLGRLAAEHGAEPVLQMEPTMALSAIAAGRDDSYLRHLSQQVRAYRHRLILSFAPEANGNWYSYGWTNAPAADYQKAWKHVMSEVTARNVTWMDTLNVSYSGSGPLADYIVPHVMVGIDGYLGRPDQTFASALQPTISQVRKLTSAPVMLSETSADQAYQPQQIPGLVQGARQDHLAGLIWLDQDQEGGLYHQHWSLTQAGAAALKASLRPLSIPVQPPVH